MAGWEIPLGIVLTIIGGIALAVQAGINASLAVNTTKPFAGRQRYLHWSAGAELTVV